MPLCAYAAPHCSANGVPQFETVFTSDLVENKETAFPTIVSDSVYSDCLPVNETLQFSAILNTGVFCSSGW